MYTFIVQLKIYIDILNDVGYKSIRNRICIIKISHGTYIDIIILSGLGVALTWAGYDVRTCQCVHTNNVEV